MSLPKLRSLQARIALFFVILLITVQAVLVLLVSVSGERIAKDRIAQDLLVGERVFRRLIEQSNRQLADAARILAADFGFRTAIATRDYGTIVSVLANHGARIDANVVMLADLDRKLLADTLHPEQRATEFPFPDLIALAERDRQASSIVLIDGKPYQVVVVPVLAPVPIAWVAMGFVIDDRVAHDLRAVAALHVTFLSERRNGRWTLHASTLPGPLRAALIESGSAAGSKVGLGFVKLAGEEYETLAPVLGSGPEGNVVALLQRSLRESLEPFERLRSILLVMTLFSIGMTIAGSVLIARSVSRPVNRLATIARSIRDGDYSQKAAVEGQDEIGELAASFNHMLDGISAREEEILRLAYEDTLTALPNRAMFLDRLQQAVLTARRTNDPVSVMMLDLDRFKVINDSLGHAAGDQVLREVAHRLRELLRDSDTVARLGGDEFAVLLPTGTSDGVAIVAQRILRTLEAPIMLEGQPVDIGASIGVASFPEHDDEGDSLLRHADVAMYVAKRANSGYAIYDPRYEEGRQTQLSLLSELRRAVENDELSLFYQPKIDLKTGMIRRAEALVRWIHPTRGFVPPVEFIPFAEQTGYIKRVTRWVVERAVQQAGEWHRDRLDIAISVNVSTRDLMSNELVDLVAALLQKHAVPAEQLCLEITESSFMEDPARALETLGRLHALGVRLSVDDFGTGYSSLAYLKKLPVEEIKIDRSFVMHMVEDEDDAIIVRSTIELGHNMGLEVVAEGVEDHSGMEFLKRLGCDQVQGYYISKPLPTPQFVEWLKARRAVEQKPEAASA
ncbi:MAG: EAL domain-containing protein [Burkholderiales bacterium]|nr:EAL domain-containing protein [Burkholderiales bacterium]